MEPSIKNSSNQDENCSVNEESTENGVKDSSKNFVEELLDNVVEEALENVAESSESKNYCGNETPEEDRLSQEIKVIEINSISPREPRSLVNLRDEPVITSENIQKDRRSDHKYLRLTRRFPVYLLGFDRPGLVLRNEQQSNRLLPPPPSYYPRTPMNPNTPGGFGPVNNPLNFNPNFWSSYPATIPRNTPVYLAQLVDVDSLYVIKHLEFIREALNEDFPNTYLIQNSRGECIYFASEYNNPCAMCLKNIRAVNLLFRDVYENEVIYMNKYCGCTGCCCFCCYPVMEVYAPPSNPLGAIVRVTQSFENEFTVVDANENKIFEIHGAVLANMCGNFGAMEYSIHSVDRNKTKVALIKQDFVDFPTFYLNSRIHGINFFQNLDVRIKAILLGALMLFELT